MNIQCKIIEDLIPLYHDGICSDESRQIVEEHIAQCVQCRSLLNNMESEINFPGEEADVETLKGIGKEIRKRRKKALLAGVSITLAAVLIFCMCISTWWYCHEYTYYSSFAEAGKAAYMNYESENLKQKNRYVWYDDAYQYEVVVPDFLSTGGFVGMSRLDNSEEKKIELAITRWEHEKYIFHILISSDDETLYFIVDSELGLHGNYPEEEIKIIDEKLNEYKDEVQELVEDALEMWEFIK